MLAFSLIAYSAKPPPFANLVALTLGKTLPSRTHFYERSHSLLCKNKWLRPGATEFRGCVIPSRQCFRGAALSLREALSRSEVVQVLSSCGLCSYSISKLERRSARISQPRRALSLCLPSLLTRLLRPFLFFFDVSVKAREVFRFKASFDGPFISPDDYFPRALESPSANEV